VTTDASSQTLLGIFETRVVLAFGRNAVRNRNCTKLSAIAVHNDRWIDAPDAVMGTEASCINQNGSVAGLYDGYGASAAVRNI
jgi:hypothetical protein